MIQVRYLLRKIFIDYPGRHYAIICRVYSCLLKFLEINSQVCRAPVQSQTGSAWYWQIFISWNVSQSNYLHVKKNYVPFRPYQEQLNSLIHCHNAPLIHSWLIMHFDEGGGYRSGTMGERSPRMLFWGFT